MARNAFQSLIEHRAKLAEPALTQLAFFLADLWQSIDASRLADQYDSARAEALDIVKEDIRDAVDQVNCLRGYPNLRGDRKKP